MNIKYILKLIIEFVGVMLFSLGWGVGLGYLVSIIYFRTVEFEGIMTGFVGAYILGPILYYGIVRGKLTASNFGVLFCVCTTSAILCAPFSPLLPVAVMPAVLAIGCLLIKIKADEKETFMEK